jgi:hypothetical protein
MSVNVTQLLPAHFKSVETRLKIHAMTGQQGGPSPAQRAQFAAHRGVRNVTKYWPLPTVLAACDRWGIEPVLTQTGARYVKKNGGLSYTGNAAQATPTPEVAAVKQSDSRFYSPPVTVGGGGRAPVPQGPGPRTSDTVVQGVAQGTPDAERERKLAALEDMITRKVAEKLTEQVGKDDEAIKEIVATVSAAAAGAVMETKGRALFEAVEARADARLQEAITKIDEARPVEVVVRTPEGEVLSRSKSNGVKHAAYPRVLRLAALRLNIAAIGPTGCGKTHMFRDVAMDLFGNEEDRFATISCTMGTSETHLTGGLLPTGEAGRFEPYVTDFIRLFRDGGLFLIDEYDSIDPNVALKLNQALANGYIDLPVLGRVSRHRDFVCVAALNTYGTGFNREYVGRSQLDEASLDRFRAGQVEMDYDRAMEGRLKGPRTGHFCNDWLNRAWQVRDAIRAARLRRNMSTRFILDGHDLIATGDTVEQVLTTFSLGWSPDELAKVGIKQVSLY